MFCNRCGRKLPQETRFCIHCGAEQPMAATASAQAASAPLEPPIQPVQTSTPLPAQPVQSERTPESAAIPKSSKSKGLLFGIAGAVIGAAALAALLLAAGVLSFGGDAADADASGDRDPGGITIQGSGFDTPEEAAKAYLEALRDQDFDAMLSAFAVESLAENYDFDYTVERVNAYTLSYDMRFPNSNEFNLQLNIAGRRNAITNQISIQYVQYNAPDALNNGAAVYFEDADARAAFVERFEQSTADYVFADLAVIGTMSSLDLSDEQQEALLNSLPDDLRDDAEDILENMLDLYTSDTNQQNIEKQVKAYGVDLDDVANVIITFEAHGETWVFCPQVIRYDGKWYIQTMTGNVSNLLGMPVYMGGIVPVDFEYFE